MLSYCASTLDLMCDCCEELVGKFEDAELAWKCVAVQEEAAEEREDIALGLDYHCRLLEQEHVGKDAFFQRVLVLS